MVVWRKLFHTNDTLFADQGRVGRELRGQVVSAVRSTGAHGVLEALRHMLLACFRGREGRQGPVTSGALVQRAAGAAQGVVGLGLRAWCLEAQDLVQTREAGRGRRRLEPVRLDARIAHACRVLELALEHLREHGINDQLLRAQDGAVR